MTELPKEESTRYSWLKGLAAAGWAFSVILGAGGLGLVAGLAFGVWDASQTPRPGTNDDFFVSIGKLVGAVIYGVIGFVGGSAAGLLVLAIKGIARLARRIVKARSER